MNQNQKHQENIKIFLAMLVAVIGVWGYYNIDMYIEGIQYLPILFLVVGVIVSLIILIIWSNVGRRFVVYLGDAIKEIKKVVWPTKNYALRLMGFVIIFVTLLAAYLYGVDTLISWVFSFILRG